MTIPETLDYLLRRYDDEFLDVSDRELTELVAMYLPGEDSGRLIRKFGTVEKILSDDPKALIKEGIEPDRAVFLSLLGTLYRKYGGNVRSDGPIGSKPEAEVFISAMSENFSAPSVIAAAVDENNIIVKSYGFTEDVKATPSEKLAQKLLDFFADTPANKLIIGICTERTDPGVISSAVRLLKILSQSAAVTMYAVSGKKAVRIKI